MGRFRSSQCRPSDIRVSIERSGTDVGGTKPHPSRPSAKTLVFSSSPSYLPPTVVTVAVVAGWRRSRADPGWQRRLPPSSLASLPRQIRRRLPPPPLVSLPRQIRRHQRQPRVDPTAVAYAKCGSGSGGSLHCMSSPFGGGGGIGWIRWWRWQRRVDPAALAAAKGRSGRLFFTVSHFFYRITCNRIQIFSSEFVPFLESEIFYFFRTIFHGRTMETLFLF